MSYTFIESHKADVMDTIITMEKQPGRIGRLFGVKPKNVQFIGSGTIWRTFPEFEQCNWQMQEELFHHWKEARQHREFSERLKSELKEKCLVWPLAHEKMIERLKEWETS